MSYIKKHKPKNGAEYKPKHPDKYVGEYPIWTRSTWETKMCHWLDTHPNVISWSSEPDLGIKYQDPTQVDPKTGKLKVRRYYPDFLFKLKYNDGKMKIFLVEVKPYKETPMAKPAQRKQGKKRSSVLYEQKTQKVNRAKYIAAKRYCKLRGWEFKFITEKSGL